MIMNLTSAELGNLGLKYGDVNSAAEQFKSANDMANASIINTATENINKAKNELAKAKESVKSANLALKTAKAKKYATGSRFIREEQLGWTQEKGQELVFRRSDGAMLTPLGKGDKVFTADMTDNLWRLSQMYVKESMSRNVPDVAKINNNIKPVFNIDNSITVEGNADEITVDQIRQITDERLHSFEKTMTEDFAMFGHKLRYY